MTALATRRARQLWYAPLLALAMGLMMVRLLVMARLLSIEAFAGFSGGLLVSGTFSTLGCLGLQTLLQRAWPVNLVLGQERRGIVLALQCVFVAAACGVVCLLLIAAGIVPSGMQRQTLVAGLLHGIAQQFFLIATVESRSRGDSIRFAWQNLVRAVAALVLGAAVAVSSGSAWAVLMIDAIVSAILAATNLQTSMTHVRSSIVALLQIAWRRIPALPWRTSLTLMTIMIVGFALLNVDRWVAADLLSPMAFAHYSFAWIVLSVAQSVQLIINASMFPALARRYAAGGRRAALALCIRASLGVLGLGILVSWPLALLAEAGIRFWYPQYADATILIPLFILVAVLRVSDFWSSYLLVTGSENNLLRANLAAAACGMGAWALVAVVSNDGSPGIFQIGWLPVAMTVAAYAAVGTLSWIRR